MWIFFGVVFLPLCVVVTGTEMTWFGLPDEGIASTIQHVEEMYYAARHMDKTLATAYFKSIHYHDIDTVSLCDIFELPNDLRCADVDRDSYLASHTCVYYGPHQNHVYDKIDWEGASCLVGIPRHFYSLVDSRSWRIVDGHFPYVLRKKYTAIYKEATESLFKELKEKGNSLVVVHWHRGDHFVQKCPMEDNFNCDSVEGFVADIKRRISSMNIANPAVYVATNEVHSSSLDYLMKQDWKILNDLEMAPDHTTIEAYLVEVQLMVHADVFIHVEKSGIPVLVSRIQTDMVKDKAVTGGSSVITEQCRSWFGQREFVPTALQKARVAFLASFPGSGNTWARLLIEYSTGYYTGSVYDDTDLLVDLPGEFNCDTTVSVIKMHPEMDRASNMLVKAPPECQDENGSPIKMNRAILIYRNPFDAIWSEFQRQQSHSHFGRVKIDSFDWRRWRFMAGVLSRRYRQMWAEDYRLISETLPTEDVLYVRYEDMKDSSKREKELRKIVVFLDYTADTEIDKSPFKSHEELLDHRVSCGFMLAEKGGVHRGHEDEHLFMTKALAYADRDIVCSMWSIFGKYAEQQNYRIYKDTDCDGYKFILQQKPGKSDLLSNIATWFGIGTNRY